jgi:Tol biopolymer transport system component
MNWRKRKWSPVAAAAALLALSAVVAWYCLAGWDLPSECAAAGRPARIRPGYSQTVIPPNIAPLNFLVEEPGVEYRVRIHGTEGKDVIIGSRSPSIVIPPQPWRRLLAQNRGGRIVFDVYAKDGDGRWSRFDPITNEVAQEEIDSHLVYRLLGPVAGLYHDMEVYQRDLESYDEAPLWTTDAVDGCMNCHSFANNRPDLFAVQVRPGMSKKSVKGGMFVVRGADAVELKTQSKAAPQRPSYIAWHPSGSAIAFSMTKTRQIFRGAGAEFREGYDQESHLALINLDTGAVSTSPGIADPAMQEAFPCWSADGKMLYFCRAKTLWGNGTAPRIEDFSKVMYDLVRVKYDINKNEWGTPETVLAAAETGMSIGEPRASPDGRYLLFCMAAYGSFFPFQANSDLYLLDLENGTRRRLECNSDNSEAWHCWSSNSRWIVFSSRRDVPLLSRLYFSHIDAKGNASKPFLLPQEDPSGYDSHLKAYNVPELVTGPIAISQRALLQAIRSANASSDEPQQPIPAKEEPKQHN